MLGCEPCDSAPAPVWVGGTVYRMRKNPKFLPFSVNTPPPQVRTRLIPLTLRFIAGGASRHHTPLPNVVTGGPFSYSDSERHTPNRKGSRGGRSVRGREPLFQTGKHAGPGTEHIATARRARRRSSPAHLRRQIGGSALGADGVIVPRLEELASGNPTWALQPGGSLSRRQQDLLRRESRRASFECVSRFRFTSLVDLLTTPFCRILLMAALGCVALSLPHHGLPSGDATLLTEVA